MEEYRRRVFDRVEQDTLIYKREITVHKQDLLRRKEEVERELRELNEQLKLFEQGGTCE